MRVRAGARTDVGRLRERNEDSYLVEEPLFAVADGMGGHRGGDVASALALEVIGGAAGTVEAEDGPLQALVEEIREANRRVLERGESDSALRGMGTTLTAIVTDGDRAHVAHIGDSRAYLLRGGSLQQLTEDHTLVQRMVRAGRLEPEEAGRHPQRSIVTRALGVDEEIDVDQLTLDLHPGDRLLLCTDGLTTMLERDAIQRVLESEPDPQRACDVLVDSANRAGGDDNITVVVLDVLEDGAEGAPAEAAATQDLTDRAATGSPAPPANGETATPAGDEELTTAVRRDPGRAKARDGGGRGRRAWRRAALWAGALVVLVAVAAVGVRLYVDGQWYVGDENGRVAIFQGIPSTVLGYDLSQVEETTEIPTAAAAALAPWSDLADGITANSLEDARSLVEQIRQDLGEAGPVPAGGGG